MHIDGCCACSLIQSLLPLSIAVHTSRGVISGPIRCFTHRLGATCVRREAIVRSSIDQHRCCDVRVDMHGIDPSIGETMHEYNDR